MAYQIYAGSTSQTVRFFVQDTSSTAGAGLTGLTHSSSGLTCYYSKGIGAATSITLASQTATGAYTSGGFCAVDGTNMPGLYRLDLPDAVVDTEAEVIVMLKGAANMAPVSLRITCKKLQANAVTVADKTGYALTVTPPTSAEIADAVWDEILTGATHNIQNSAGKRLRTIASQVVHTGTAQGPGTGSNQIQLDAGASATDGVYDPGMVYIESGTGAGQSRLITQYVGSTRTATVDRDWRVAPAADSVFVIQATIGLNSVNEGLAQGGTATTIVLNASANSVDDCYNGQLVFLKSGTGQDQVAIVEDYTGATRTALIRTRRTNGQWATIPDSTTGYMLVPNLTWTIDEIQAGLATAAALATLTGYVDTEVAAIKVVTDRINTGLVADGIVWQFTANMLELAPAGGGGGGGGSGDASLANQVLILDQLDVIQNKTDLISGASGITSLLAGAVLDPGSITSFPEVLTVGDSYTEANGRAIQIPIVDTNSVPISSTGSLYFSSATVTFVIKRAGETDSDRIISGTAAFVDPPGTGTGDEAPYAVIELLSSETSKGLTKYKYTGILTFTWPGTSDEVMSFETNTITFRE